MENLKERYVRVLETLADPSSRKYDKPVNALCVFLGLGAFSLVGFDMYMSMNGGVRVSGSVFVSIIIALFSGLIWLSLVKWQIAYFRKRIDMKS